MRQGRVFKRCGKCSRKVEGKRCGDCGYAGVSWAFVVDVAPKGAPRRQRSRQGFATKAEALDAMAELQGDAAAGRAVEPSKVTVGEYLIRWLETVRPPIMRETSHETATQHVRVHLSPRVGEIPLQSLDRTAVKAAYASMRAERGLAPATVHRVHTTLRRALHDAVEDRLIPANPAVGASTAPQHAEQDEVETWTAEELAAFLTWAVDEDPGWFALWRLVSHTGLRRSEVMRLRWRDVDLDAGTVTVAKSKSPRGRRTIDVDAETVAVLRDHRRSQLEARMAAGPAWQDRGLVFCREDGTAWHLQSVSRAFTRAVQRSGLTPVTLKGLRHTHATLLLLAGVPLHVVSRRLGHASEAFTAQVYAHVLPQQGAHAAATFAALVQGDRPESVSEL